MTAGCEARVTITLSASEAAVLLALLQQRARRGVDGYTAQVADRLAKRLAALPGVPGP